MSFWYWLVSWLPFEWAAPDTMLFMKNALLAVLVVTPLFGLLSTMVVESRMAFFSDALGHSAFTGMAIGALCGLAEPVGAAVVFAVVIALLFTLIRQKTHMASDTAISVFSSAAVALGIFLSTWGAELHQVQQPPHRRHPQRGPGGDRPAGSHPPGSGDPVGHLLQPHDALLRPPGPGGQPGHPGGVEELPLHRRHRRGGDHHHDLGGPFGDQRPAGPPRGGGSERGPEPAPVPPGLRSGWLVCGIGGCCCPITWGPHRRLHHPAAGGVVLRLLLFLEKAEARQPAKAGWLLSLL